MFRRDRADSNGEDRAIRTDATFAARLFAAYPIQKALDLFAFFPHARAVFRAANPAHADIPPKGLPQLLFRRRRALGLTKRETARRLGVHVEMIGKWERGENQPRAMHHPAIIEFLDDCSWIPSGTPSQQLKFTRLVHGLSQKRLSKWLGFPEKQINRWERGIDPPSSVTIAISGLSRQ